VGFNDTLLDGSSLDIVLKLKDANKAKVNKLKSSKSLVPTQNPQLQAGHIIYNQMN